MTEEARIRLSLETSAARQQIAKFRNEFKEAAQDASGMMSSMAGALGGGLGVAAAGIARTAGASISSVVGGARQGIQGAGIGGGAFEAEAGARLAALDAGVVAAETGVSAAVSSATGNPALGKFLGSLAGGAAELATKPERDRIEAIRRSVEQSTGETTARFGPGVVRGGQIDPEVLAESTREGTLRAFRQIMLEGQSREGSGVTGIQLLRGNIGPP